jgi:hypothetical protein
MENPTSP